MKIKIISLILGICGIITGISKLSAQVVPTSSGYISMDINKNLTSDFSASTSGAIKILPLGNSIPELGGEEGVENYRYGLWTRLLDASWNVDYVGLRTDEHTYQTYLGQTFDPDHQGTAGINAVEVNEELASQLASISADITLIHLGTNDIEGAVVDSVGTTVAQITNYISEIIDKLQADNPNMTIYLAQIIPVGSSYTNATANSSVTIVDQFTGIGDADLADAKHPNASGAEKMAQKWADALLGTTPPASNKPNIRVYDPNINVYPNPVNEYLNLEIVGIQGLIQIKIFNVYGVEVYSDNMYIESHLTKQLSLHNLSYGNYIIHISNNFNSYTKGFIVTRCVKFKATKNNMI